MFIRIPIPRGVAPSDFDRLRSHAAWYRRQVLRHGPAYGARRGTRAKRPHFPVALPAGLVPVE